MATSIATPVAESVWREPRILLRSKTASGSLRREIRKLYELRKSVRAICALFENQKHTIATDLDDSKVSVRFLTSAVPITAHARRLAGQAL